MGRGFIIYAEKPDAIPKFYEDLVNTFLKPLAERIEREEKRLGRKLNESELTRVIREVCREASETLEGGAGGQE